MKTEVKNTEVKNVITKEYIYMGEWHIFTKNNTYVVELSDKNMTIRLLTGEYVDTLERDRTLSGISDREIFINWLNK